jgi:hypothetical protein
VDVHAPTTLLPLVDSRDSKVHRALTLAGFAAFTAYVYVLDPDKHAAYPVCPSRVLLHIDCPACGGLRGTNALLHGRVREALDHNLLLPLYLAAIALTLGLWSLPLVGLPQRKLHLPRWLLAVLVVVVGAFTVARNLPGHRFAYLASDA